MVVHGRYELRDLLGQGAQGEVWAAVDTLSEQGVALKLFRARDRVETARVRREIAALHLLRIPGVVRLLDEGVHEGRPFVVMELVEGRPFPGAPVPARWSDIAETTIALLETLRGVHAAGVVHRDLKPSNILVHASGRPVLLDFGLALGAPIGVGLTRTGTMVGTPAYLAPEQILGGAIGPEADLYSVGALLHEALSGRLSHDSEDMSLLLHERLSGPPEPLYRLAPQVPRLVSDVVSALLRTRASERPSSAGEVIRLLGGASAGRAAEDVLAPLGDRQVVQAVVRAALSGEACDLVESGGAGKTYCLGRAVRLLSEQGRRVIECVSGVRPFASLAPLVGDLSAHRGAGLSRVTEIAETIVQTSLKDGVVLVCDDNERLDPWSRKVIARCRSSGAVLRGMLPGPADEAAARKDRVRIVPFSARELEGLFTGMDRLFHLREDAAAVLWERTGGHAARVSEELMSWLRAGIARRDGDRFTVDRDTLDRLRADRRAREVRAESTLESGEATGAARDLLAWVSVAWPDSTPSVLSAAMDEALWCVEAGIGELSERGLVRVLPDDRAQPLVPPRASEAWSVERRRASQRAVAAALPPRAEGRFLHLALAIGPESSDGELRELSQEARARALTLALQGSLGEAVVTLDEGLRVLRAHSRPGLADTEIELLSLWVEVALEVGTPHALDRALYEVSRSESWTEEIAQLDALLRAGLDAQSAPALDALARIEGIVPFADAGLGRRREVLRALVARRCPPERHEEIVRQQVAWAERSGDAESLSRARSFRGRWLYRSARFLPAASEHFAASEGTSWATTRIAEMLFAASACMEGFQLDRAAGAARAALELAVRGRDPYLEARAEWLTRCIDYRRQLPMAPDVLLVEAVRKLGMPDLEALVCLQEGTIAWRAGEMGLAVECCGASRRIWEGLGKPWGVLLSRAVMLAAGAELLSGELDWLLAQAAACPIPGVGAQVLALSARREGPSPRWRAAIREAAEAIPAQERGYRMDVMSVEEALSAASDSASW
ncbi:MAG: serine/threonine-protein kinase [Polyangiaceae bacterium]